MSGQLIRFGSLSLLYDEGFIRYIRWGDFEIVRMIYFALRDNNWTTAGIVRSDEKVSVTAEGFAISYTATNVVGGESVLRWSVQISGNASGEISFAIDGHALAKYNRNRAGICVLHPIRETVSRAVRVTRPDGTNYESRFPKMINPHQPFLDITRMRWQLEKDAWAELEFEGDIFETEDQRNWSDTSFKTYSTPLTVPYPVMLKPGDKVSQKVILKLGNVGKLPVAGASTDIEITLDEEQVSIFPKIGTEFSGTDLSSHKDVGLLTDLGFEHLRIELNLTSKTWRQLLEAGLAEAKAISASPFVHLVFGDKPVTEWDQFAKQLGTEDKEKISRLAISPTDRKANVDELLRAVVPKARAVFPDAAIGAGFTSYFTELNRNRFDYSAIDFVIYPITPQAHATDSYTVIENLPAQEDAVRSVGSFAKGKKIHVGPISLRPRSNPEAKSEEKEDKEGRGALPHHYDVRQATALAAGWALASVKYLGEIGADSITMFESHGMAGYFMSNDDWRHKDFPSELKIFPVYDALLSLRKLRPERIVRSRSSNPLVCTSLVVENDDERYLVLINHTDVGVMVKLAGGAYPINGWEIHITSIHK